MYSSFPLFWEPTEDEFKEINGLSLSSLTRKQGTSEFPWGLWLHLYWGSCEGLGNELCLLPGPAHTGSSASVGTCLGLWCALNTLTESQIHIFTGTYLTVSSGSPVSPVLCRSFHWGIAPAGSFLVIIKTWHGPVIMNWTYASKSG